MFYLQFFPHTIIGKFAFLMLDFVVCNSMVVDNRWFIVGKSSSSDILYDLCSIIGSKVRFSSYGCISTLLTNLVDIITSCWWFGCCCSGMLILFFPPNFLEWFILWTKLRCNYPWFPKFIYNFVKVRYNRQNCMITEEQQEIYKRKCT